MCDGSRKNKVECGNDAEEFDRKSASTTLKIDNEKD
jgi:hypothetical protein